MAYYIMQEMPDLRGDGKRVLYPKLIIEDQVNLDRIARDISDNSTFSLGEVQGVLYALIKNIERYAGWGYSVKIDGLGVFTPSLQYKRDVEREEVGGTKRNAASIEVGGVNFRVDRSLVGNINQHCDLRRSRQRTYTKHRAGQEERLAMALDYMRTHGYMRLQDYTVMTGLSRSTACRELRRFHAERRIGGQGFGAHSVYVLPQPQTESEG